MVRVYHDRLNLRRSLTPLWIVGDSGDFGSPNLAEI